MGDSDSCELVNLVILDIASFRDHIHEIAATPIDPYVKKIRLLLPGIFDRTTVLPLNVKDHRDLTYRICCAIEEMNDIHKLYQKSDILFCGFSYDSVDDNTLTTDIEIIGNYSTESMSSHGDRTLVTMLEMGLEDVKRQNAAN